MRWRYFIVLQVIIFLIIGGLVYKHQSNVRLVKTPPVELAQWYKPINKRQVWLHNMFSLRREMQAVALYAKQQDEKHLAKWTEQLGKHYLKIAKMIPSWQKKLDMQAIISLNSAVAAKDYSQIEPQLKKLQASCDSCHEDYQAVTALTYRSADFSSIMVNDKTPFAEHMSSLTEQVNQIKISAQDGFTEEALSSLTQLNLSMNSLGETCINCHKNDQVSYPNDAMNITLHNLKNALLSGTSKEQGKELGTLAVLACAKCHGTHRIVSGAKTQLTKEMDFSELIKH